MNTTYYQIWSVSDEELQPVAYDGKLPGGKSYQEAMRRPVSYGSCFYSKREPIGHKYHYKDPWDEDNPHATRGRQLMEEPDNKS